MTGPGWLVLAEFGRPVPWVVLVLAVGIVARLLAARLESPWATTERWLGLFGPEARALLASVYLVVPFIVAVRLRLADPHELGLALPTSALAVAVAIGLAAGAGLCAVLAFHQVKRAAGAVSEPVALRPALLGALAWTALQRELHWAFVRSAPLSVGLANTAFAIGIGLALLSLEAWSDPRRRREFTDPEGALVLAPRAALAVISAGVVLFTGSLAMALLAHVAVAAVLTKAGLGLVLAPDLSPAPGPPEVEPTVV